jgi:nucleotide-binding universal stress UspA family protein
LFKNILVATDGSDLAAKAVEQGIRLAKEIGAKITAMTVTEPFHLLSVEPSQLEYTPIEYKKHAQAYRHPRRGQALDDQIGLQEHRKHAGLRWKALSNLYHDSR